MEGDVSAAPAGVLQPNAGIIPRAVTQVTKACFVMSQKGIRCYVVCCQQVLCVEIFFDVEVFITCVPM